MTDSWHVIRIRLFERVAAGPATSLLRVEGKPGKRRRPGQRPNLVLDRDGLVTRFAAIPAPPDPRGILRAAYSVSSALITSDSKFWLEHSDGSLTELPHPTPGVSRSEPESDLEPEPASAEDAEPQADPPLHAGPEAERERDRRSSLLAKLSEQSVALAEAERAVGETEQARQQAAAELAHAQARIDALEHQLAEAESMAQAQAAAALAEAQQQAAAALAGAQQHAAAALAQAQNQLAEAESRSTEADLRTAESQQRAIEAESRADAAEARATKAESRAAEAASQVKAAEARVAESEGQARAALADANHARELFETLELGNQELTQTIGEQQERIKSLELVVAATPEHGELERELGALRAGRASVEQELDQARDQLRIMTFERDELSRQAAAFDGVAVKARERATKAEATNEQLSERIQELETWRGELERRLAATTSELGVAKVAREADDRELRRLRLALADLESGGGEVEGHVSESARMLAAQAAEIEHLAAELAALRAQGDIPVAAGFTGAAAEPVTAARVAELEAERAEIARRAGELHAALAGVLEPAQLLAKLAHARLEPSAPSTETVADDDIELISRTAEQAAREQAERELRAAVRPSSSGQRPAG